MTQITTCEACDNVVAETAKRSPTQWLCIKFPRLEGSGFVAPKTWTDLEPYMRCSGINGGSCPMFTPRRTKEKAP